MKLIIQFSFLLLLLSASGCVKEIPIENLDQILQQRNFRIDVVYYGGLVGRSDQSYEFKLLSDSVIVYTIDYGIRPNDHDKFKIPIDAYNEVITSLLCMKTFHQESKVPGGGCIGPWDAEYWVVGRFKKVRIFPSFENKCSVEKIIYSK